MAQHGALQRLTAGLPWRGDLLVLCVLTIVTFIVRAAWFGDPNADIDEQLYSLIGLEMTRGALPFVDVWDRKPIGLFAIFAFAHAIGGPGPTGYQVLAALFTLAGAWMTYLLALRLADRITAAGAGVLYVFLISIYGSNSAQSEAFWVPMMLGMALLVIDTVHENAARRALMAMLVGGLALQVKYTALPQCVFFGLWALWGQHRKGCSPAQLALNAAAYAALGILPTAVVAAAYALAGHWDAFLFANFTSFFDRLPSRSGRLRSDSLLFLMPVIGLLLAATYAAVRLSPPQDRRTYAFVVLWLAASLATIYLPSTVYLYYFAALAPAVALFAVPLMDRRGALNIVPLTLVLVGFGYLLFLPSQYEKAEEHRVRMQALASAIAPYVGPEHDCLYIFDGPTALYPMSGSCLPTRFIYPDHQNNALERYSLGVSQTAEVARILATEPPVIVTADKHFTPQNEEAKAMVWARVRRDYVDVERQTLHERVIRVWVRKPLVRR